VAGAGGTIAGAIPAVTGFGADDAVLGRRETGLAFGFLAVLVAATFFTADLDAAVFFRALGCGFFVALRMGVFFAGRAAFGFAFFAFFAFAMGESDFPWRRWFAK
jgi:hypothetical protein